MTTDEKILRMKLVAMIIIVAIGGALLAFRLIDEQGFIEFTKTIGGLLWSSG